VKIYLDVSCLNRPFDDQSQERIRLESIAVTAILENCAKGEWTHVSSVMALIEIANTPNVEKRKKLRALLPPRGDIIDLEEPILTRAMAIEAMGFHRADAAHVAAAEAQKAGVLLTTDDQLLRAARRSRDRLAVKVLNPIEWLEEQRDVHDT